MDLSQLLSWLGLALGAVGATALVVAGPLAVLDDVLADRASLDRHGRGRTTDAGGSGW